MGQKRSIGVCNLTIWATVVAAIAVPLALASTSPLLAWRDPIYIAAGLAGVLAMSLLLLQPLLSGGKLPGLRPKLARLVHRLIGGMLVSAVVMHVVGLWITSPPDVVDALFFRSPTPLSAWGVIAMWAVLVSACLATFRRRLRLHPQVWRLAHTVAAIVVVAGTVVHALLIEGTMETISKATLSALLVAATVVVVADQNLWGRRKP